MHPVFILRGNKMKSILKYSCLLIIIAAVALSSFPVFHTGDMNHDRSVDLQDLVLSAKNIVETATVSADFVKSFNGFYAAAQVVAGFAHIIKTNQDTNFSSTADQVFLLPLQAEMPRLCVRVLPVVGPDGGYECFYPPERRPPRVSA